jgi:putative endonuclease
VASKEKIMTNPIDPRRRFGNRGEELAALFFEARGFRVIERNWSCRLGEIDLVVERAGHWHFVEVKTRHGHMYGFPEEAVTRSKLQKLRRAIEMYLLSRPAPIDLQIDVLAITLGDAEPEYHYIEGVG